MVIHRKWLIFFLFRFRCAMPPLCAIICQLLCYAVVLCYAVLCCHCHLCSAIRLSVVRQHIAWHMLLCMYMYNKCTGRKIRMCVTAFFSLQYKITVYTHMYASTHFARVLSNKTVDFYYTQEVCAFIRGRVICVRL